jgi:hypothetical protein
MQEGGADIMFNNAIEQALAAKDKALTNIVKLGKVTSVSGGRARVQHYGESTTSGKDYTYIDGYLPEVDDVVAMLPQANTYIIIGKVCNGTPVQKYVDFEYLEENYLPIAYKNKIANDSHNLTLDSNNLVPDTNEILSIGTSQKQLLEVHSMRMYLDGTQLRPDGIVVGGGTNTYSIILTLANNIGTLTPSSDNTFALGTSSRKLKEAWLGLFRGSWKSGQSTERQISWNSSNALLPDLNDSIDIGTSSVHFKDAYLRRMIGALAYSSSSGYLSWTSATVLAPSANNSIELGKSGNQFNAVYTNKLYLNGTEFDPSGTVIDKLTTKYASTNYTLTLSAKNAGAGNQYYELTPSVNLKFNIGNANYKMQDIYLNTLFAVNWHNGTRYLKFDTSHNIYPDTTNVVSLGTSSKQYKNIYGQNIYVNGTAVSSDRRVKENIKDLEEKHLAFFKALRPVQYKFKEGDSGRTHTGFIAQEVEEAVEEAGMTSQDMAVVVKDPSDRYYLRYEEIISVQTKVIQDLMAKVESLEARITKLEGKGENK